MSVIYLVVDLMFEQSENVTIARFLVLSSLASSEGCGLHNNGFKICVAFICTEILTGR
jgi:hypothetical protein